MLQRERLNTAHQIVRILVQADGGALSRINQLGILLGNHVETVHRFTDMRHTDALLDALMARMVSTT